MKNEGKKALDRPFYPPKEDSKQNLNTASQLILRPEPRQLEHPLGDAQL